ncbi:STAS domain-containing protein [Streptomyces sp. NPDC097107]|uniref:STAS domain-containing protein n=1 Tax=Streptomyces sp. NPDC097107 TaxID=3366089 RepID=UPI003803A1EE
MSSHETGTSGRPGNADRSREQATARFDPRDPEVTTVVQYEWRDAWVVAARGAYDMHSITPLADALDTAAGGHRKVVLDASGITFADSTLLNLLILTCRATDLRVAAPTRQLQRILELTGVDTVLTVRATVEDAAAG